MPTTIPHYCTAKRTSPPREASLTILAKTHCKNELEKMLSETHAPNLYWVTAQLTKSNTSSKNAIKDVISNHSVSAMVPTSCIRRTNKNI